MFRKKVNPCPIETLVTRYPKRRDDIIKAIFDLDEVRERVELTPTLRGYILTTTLKKGEAVRSIDAYFSDTVSSVLPRLIKAAQATIDEFNRLEKLRDDLKTIGVIKAAKKK